MSLAYDAVVNASPLIFLGKLGELDLLPERTATTPTVLEEIGAGDPVDHPEVDLIHTLVEEKALGLQQADTTLVPATSGLHAGEGSVLALAVEHEMPEVIVDDRVAIRTAKVLGLRPVSTPFLLLRACRAGERTRDSFQRSLDRLLALGYHLSPRLYKRLLDATPRTRPSP